jgi:GT2 family glycosyltransferase
MLTRTPSEVLATPRAARLSQNVGLVLWQAAGEGERGFRPCLDSAPMPRPHAAVRLDPATDTYAGLLRFPRALPAGGLIRLAADPQRTPAIAIDAIEGTAEALWILLSATARSRLLGFLMEIGSGLFGLGQDHVFVHACRKLAASLDSEADPACTARIAAQLPGGLQLIVVPTIEAATATGAAGATGATGATGAWHLLRAGSVQRLPSVLADGTCHVLARNAAAGDTLLAAGGGMPRRLLLPAERPPHLLGWLRAAPAATASAVRGLLHEAALPGPADDAPLRELRRELALLVSRPAQRHEDPRAPVAASLDLSLPDGRGGMFLRGWISDPHALIRTLSLRLPWGEVPIAPDALHRFPRPELAGRLARSTHSQAAQGFVAHLSDVGGDAFQPTLALGLGSGAEISLVAPARTLEAAAARDAVLASMPPAAASTTIMEQCLAPAAGRLHAAVLAGPRAADIVRIGAATARPHVSMLIPLYRTLSFMRAQAAAFARDPASRDVETIFVLDSPEQRHEVEHLLRGLSLMLGLGITLVVMPRNLGYAAANNAGAAAARGRHLLLLNSDVVPDRCGWLAPMLAALADRRAGAAGPKLLFEDSSIQHAGLFFDRDPDGIWFNRHFFKGFPRGFAAAQRARRVPAVTGAALLVPRRLFERLGGITEDYIIGDYEDSDFCLKLRAAGHEIAYVPETELWHFERRSIRSHPGYARTLASQYNRRLHQARWSGQIAALMQRFSRGDGA